MFRSIFRGYKKKHPQKAFNNWKIVRGDSVQVNSGKDLGKIGEVLRVDRKRNRLQVDGVNILMKRTKGDDDGESIGGIRPKLGWIHVSNCNLVDPVTGMGTRVAIGYLEDGAKVRVSKRSGSIIEKPSREDMTYENRTKNKVDGPYDTQPDQVLEVTYLGEDFGLIRD
jgi:large subunit ribosomal protein L24